MSNYRAIQMYNNYKQSQMGATGWQVHKPRKEITPIEIFDIYMVKDTNFKNLRGWTDTYLSMGSDMHYHERKVRNHKKNIKSGFWKFVDAPSRHYAIIELPEIKQFKTRKVLKILYVDKRHQRKGIARRCMEALTSIVDKVDKYCAENKEFNGKRITHSFFSLSLLPNPFHVSNWNPKNIPNIDWSDAESATEQMVDETSQDLPRRYKSANHVKLKEFYISCGFAPCRELWYYEYIDTSNEYRWDFRRKQNVHDRTIKLNKEPLVYPAKNAEYYDSDEDAA